MSTDSILGKTEKKVRLTNCVRSYIKTVSSLLLTRKGILRERGNRKRSFGLPRKQGGTAEVMILRPVSLGRGIFL